jgi:hypothetical protein
MLLPALAACAQPPTQEIEIAASRIAQAREEGASTYAAHRFRQAEDALALAQEALSHPRQYRQAVEAASLACISVDEARARTFKEKEKIHRWADRFLRECKALMEQAHSLSPEIRHTESMESFLLRYDSLTTVLEAGNVSEAYEGASRLKEDLLRLLRSLEK